MEVPTSPSSLHPTSLHLAKLPRVYRQFSIAATRGSTSAMVPEFRTMTSFSPPAPSGLLWLSKWYHTLSTAAGPQIAPILAPGPMWDRRMHKWHNRSSLQDTSWMQLHDVSTVRTSPNPALASSQRGGPWFATQWHHQLSMLQVRTFSGANHPWRIMKVWDKFSPGSVSESLGWKLTWTQSKMVKLSQ